MIESSKLPHLMKYMGSKRELLDFIKSYINDLDIQSNHFCDLFSGTSIVGCSLKDEYNIQINDIQAYTSIFANTYLSNVKTLVNETELDLIKERVLFYVSEFSSKYPDLIFNYNEINNYLELRELEYKQQNLIFNNFEIGFHLFTKYYSSNTGDRRRYKS